MNQEIELKFSIQTSHLAALQASLDKLPAERQAPCVLSSVYYDTADCLLRQHDMALRVRQHNAGYEMTMKLAGRVSGGLQQRPEFSESLNSAEPDLSRFAAKMWPKGITAESLQSTIEPLFSTEFQRQRWHVNQGNSRIEVALDQGEIIAGTSREPLCELELELLSGDLNDVLALAQWLTEQQVLQINPPQYADNQPDDQAISIPPQHDDPLSESTNQPPAKLLSLRQCGLSKAARGYMLAQSAEDSWQPKPQAILLVPAKSTIEQGFEAALDLALTDWLYSEEIWLRKNVAGKAAVCHAIALLRHTLLLFNSLIPRKVSPSLRDGLNRCEALLTGQASAEQVAFSQQIAVVRLALLDWLMNRRWRSSLDDEALAKLDTSFKRFADIQLSRLAAELKKTFIRPLYHYQDQLPRLARSLDCVFLLSGAYSETRIRAWVENWQLLYQAITYDHRVDIDRYRQLSLAQPPFWLHSGIQNNQAKHRTTEKSTTQRKRNRHNGKVH